MSNEFNQSTNLWAMEFHELCPFLKEYLRVGDPSKVSELLNRLVESKKNLELKVNDLVEAANAKNLKVIELSNENRTLRQDNEIQKIVCKKYEIKCETVQDTIRDIVVTLIEKCGDR